MIILPAEHPLDWKRPPVVTLLLILLNLLVYVGYQSGDDQRREAAVRLYLDGGLLERERALFLNDPARHDRPADEREALEGLRRPQLATLVLFDLAFADRLHRHDAYLADAAWQRARQNAERARDKVSSMAFGFIPARFTLKGLFGAMFLHGSFEHLLGNMVFLFICGFAVESALGRWRYLGLYLAGGLASHLLWWFCEPSWVPGIGASGAVSGVMGMYIGLYGLRRIAFFYWLGPLIGYFRAPALWILPAWMGKELYGVLLASDHVNYYAHLGGLGFGFLAVWLLRRLGGMRVDEAYLLKVDPDAAFKRELAALDRAIGQFDLERAASRGQELLERYPQRLPLLERLYAVAKGRVDRPLMGALLKQVFAMQTGATLPLLQRLADDGAEPQQVLLRHPSILAQLLPRLLRAGDTARALASWRRVRDHPSASAALPSLTFALAKQLGQNGQVRLMGELEDFLNEAYPDSEDTRRLALYRRYLLG
ncbi:rhomboid family intramembrane serine protease [Pseudomonas sp. RIT-PI-AD]|uniref:rhomboid family intramembrane serine protease n=1 Tax=Pseudomonas sp. RIT-PI-AD TaxID=3035294 RepID=UPI0021D7DA30|nr:rhomboid family intramembrane serine protease [Pseudomonas sp. RIT-PI-AD]